jgi:hypothetical protein
MSVVSFGPPLNADQRAAIDEAVRSLQGVFVSEVPATHALRAAKNVTPQLWSAYKDATWLPHIRTYLKETAATGTKKNTTSLSIAGLPEGVKEEVLTKLPCQEVPKVCALDRAHREMCNAPGFWEEQYAARHTASSAAAAPKAPSVWPLERGDRQEFGKECLFVTGKTHKTLIGHTGELYSVAFSPDGRTLATGSDDNTAKLWAVRDS